MMGPRIFLLFIIAQSYSLSAAGEKGITRLGPRAEYAGPNEFPHQVSIQVFGKHVCGATLISETNALTAAHCVHDVPSHIANAYVYVEVGSSTIGDGMRIKVSGWVVHEKYTGRTVPGGPLYPFDIAIVQLSKPVSESNRVRFMKLPRENEEVPIGASTIVSGFGSEEMGTSQSYNLRKATMQVISESQCQSYWPEHMILSSQICASSGFLQATCSGDSGGPMIYNGKVVGIVSCGTEHCQKGIPDIYTKVSSYIPFIKGQMKRDLGMTSMRMGFADSTLGSAPSYPMKPSMQPPNHNQISTPPHFGQAPSNIFQRPSNIGQAPSHIMQIPSRVGPANIGQAPSYIMQIPPHVGQVPSNIGSPSVLYPMLMYPSHAGSPNPTHINSVSHYPSSIIMHHPNAIPNSPYVLTPYRHPSNVIPYHNGDQENKINVVS